MHHLQPTQIQVLQTDGKLEHLPDQQGPKLPQTLLEHPRQVLEHPRHLLGHPHQPLKQLRLQQQQHKAQLLLKSQIC